MLMNDAPTFYLETILLTFSEEYSSQNSCLKS